MVSALERGRQFPLAASLRAVGQDVVGASRRARTLGRGRRQRGSREGQRGPAGMGGRVSGALMDFVVARQ